MSNPVVLRQRSPEAHQMGGPREYTDLLERSLSHAKGNGVKFMHNIAAFGHGRITGNAFDRDGETFVPMIKSGRNQPITLAPLVTDKGIYHGLVSLPRFTFDRIGYVFSRALQIVDNYIIDKLLIGEEYQSPASPLKADSLCSFAGRLIIGIASCSVALVRLGILATSVALQAVFYVASKAIEYLVVKLLYQVLKLVAHLLWGIALAASLLTVGIVAIPVNFAKLSAWFLSLAWFSDELPIDRNTFSAVYRAFERAETWLTEFFDARPKREESSDPGPVAARDPIPHHDGLEDGSVRALTPLRRADISKSPWDYDAVAVEPPVMDL